MKFSVLMPVYNVERYLPEAVESVLRQTYSDFELILVDDGSKDAGGSICDRYAEQYPEQVRVIHKENQGLISARRTGIANAIGDFCVFIDSDDLIEPNLLAEVGEVLQNDPACDMVIYSFSYYREGKKTPRAPMDLRDGMTWSGEKKTDAYRRLVTTSEITSIWTKAIRTSLLKADPTDYSKYYGKNMAEDLLQSLYPMTAAGSITYLYRPLYDYRVDNISFTRSFDPKAIEKKNTVHVYEKILEYLPAWGMDTPEMRDRLDARWFNETMYTMAQYYDGAADAAARKEILRYPWAELLPEAVRTRRNQYESPDYQRLYQWLTEGDEKAIKAYFFRRSLRRGWKRVKKQLCGKN